MPKFSDFEGKLTDLEGAVPVFWYSPAACGLSLWCRPVNARSDGLRFGVWARNRRSRCDDSVSLGSPQLQIFQEFSRTADKPHVVARREPKRDGDFLYEGHIIF